MLDLGTSFVASVARDPDALAIVDEGIRLTYAQWYARISSLVASFDRIGLKPGDHLVTCCRIARRPPRCIGPANWRALSSRRSTGAPRPTNSISASRIPKHAQSCTRTSPRRLWKHRSAPRLCRESMRVAARRPAHSVSTHGRRSRSRGDAAASAPKPGRSCSIPPEPHRGRRACRGVIAPSGPPALRMSRKIFTGAANGRSA